MLTAIHRRSEGTSTHMIIGPPRAGGKRHRGLLALSPLILGVRFLPDSSARGA